MVVSDNIESTLYEFGDISHGTTKSSDESISDVEDEEVEDFRDKEEFFRMYKAYKEGKIKEEHLLITDLIDIQLMMLEETKLVEQKITLKNEQNETAKKQLEALLGKKAKFEKKQN